MPVMVNLRLLSRFWASLSISGLLLGTLFFAFSLTPSLLPRTFVTQGVVSGACSALGYGIGHFGQWLWYYLELPAGRPHVRRQIKLAVALAACLTALIFLWRSAFWQNSIRELMGMEPVPSIHPFEVGLIALITFILLLALARLFRHTVAWLSLKASKRMPRRLAKVIGVVGGLVLFWAVSSGVLFRAGLEAADSSFRHYDALIDPEINPPADPLKSGSRTSLLAWDELGSAGRDYVSSGPSAGELGAFLRRPAQEPIRVYVGLRSADSIEERARLALKELQRVGGFERSVLVVVVPTGTGWVDPAAIDTVEYLHGGDIASVAVQYSYLASPLALLTEPGFGGDTARALFREIYGHWTTLPRDRRPRLYLHGLSLGSMNSELSAHVLDVIGDPIHGALWSGPPFTSRIWRSIITGRNPGSPAWLPRYRDGSAVRFTNQANALALPGARWGPLRIVYLQYASDPVTFFDVSSLYRQPDWMDLPRGPDVSPHLRWYPVVTFVQLGVDMAFSTSAPAGYGHTFHPHHYIDAWMEVTDVRGWTAPDVERLKQRFGAFPD
jgi:uncharacterized membrane protein